MSPLKYSAAIKILNISIPSEIKIDSPNKKHLIMENLAKILPLYMAN